MIGKYLVLIAGIAAVAGLFMPYLAPAEGSLADVVAKAGLGTPPDVSLFALLTSPPEGVEADPEAQSGLMLLAVPAVLLLVVGLLSLAVRYGRGIGVLTLLIGAAVAGLNFIGFNAAGENPDVSAGMGMMLLLAGGGLGVVAGLLGVAMPQAKADDDKKKKDKK